MKKKKKQKNSRIKNFIYGGLALLVCIFCLGTVVSDINRFLDLQTSIQASENEYAALKSQRDELLKTRNNLSNPDYLEHYGRGQFLVSKEGETIFKFRAIDRNAASESE